MRRGRIYHWTPDPSSPQGGSVAAKVVSLPRLDGGRRLHGRYVQVRNAGHAPGSVPIGDATPNESGDFLFAPGRGGGRMDKAESPDDGFVWRYVQAAHFGEVNAYFHVDRIAVYLDHLLYSLDAQSLPPVTVVVNAHDAAIEIGGGRDGVQGTRRWLPFQGGHYRLSARRYGPREHSPISPDGEIHLGPGWQLLEHGALVAAAGTRYRANASHNAGILYHEYAHHLTRHTADFRANALVAPERQSNRKSAIDEGTCDYWAAVMLGSPHIWAWHRRHDAGEIHPRSLASSKTMADYDPARRADPHGNGTIWGAALWSLRCRLGSLEADGARHFDRVLMAALLLLGRLAGPSRGATRRARSSFSAGLSALLRADELVSGSRHRELILETFRERGVSAGAEVREAVLG